MKQQIGISLSGDLNEALTRIQNPSALILMTTEDNFENHVSELEKLFPGIPSIGCIGMSYGGPTSNEAGVTVVALSDIDVRADVIEQLSTMPMKYIHRLQKAINDVNAEKGNSVCFDFSSGYDGKLVTTLNVILESLGIPLIGGTDDCGKVSANGKVFNDSCAFMIIRNTTGKIKAYKENIYTSTGKRFVATKTDPANKLLIEVDGKPAERFYREALSITKDETSTQTFKNPFGRIYGNETYLISIKDIVGDALECYKQVNNMDILTLMELKDYDAIVEDTLNQIHTDLPNVNGILSVNCLFRYLLFKQEHYEDTYFKKMNRFGSHAGLVGLGEHFNKQHINQTMCCIAFD